MQIIITRSPRINSYIENSERIAGIIIYALAIVEQPDEQENDGDNPTEVCHHR